MGISKKYHREDGPTIEYNKDYTVVYVDGEREERPAVHWLIGLKQWYINGKYHREDGPAVIYNNGNNEEWYYHGIKAKDKEEFYDEQWRKEVLMDLI